MQATKSVAKSATSTRMLTSSCHQWTPIPSPTKKTPNDVSITPTLAFIRFSGMRVSGARSATPATITASSAAVAPTTAPAR